MSGAMLILLAACQVPVLKDLIDPGVTRVGHHLQQLFRHWQQSSLGADSPSVNQSLWIIQETDKYIADAYL